jgi:hypothetical protein
MINGLYSPVGKKEQPRGTGVSELTELRVITIVCLSLFHPHYTDSILGWMELGRRARTGRAPVVLSSEREVVGAVGEAGLTGKVQGDCCLK